MKIANKPFSLASASVGPLVALIFIGPTIASYSQTPHDPQKAIGYVIISIYGIVVGLFAGAAVFLLSRGAGGFHKDMKSFITILLGVFCGVASALLFQARFLVQ